MLEIIRDYLIRQLRFVNANREADRYWEGYEDAIKTFQEKIKYQNGELRPTFQDLHSSVQYGWAAAAVQKRYGAIY